jgi:AraC-like DNA-binding protein
MGDNKGEIQSNYWNKISKHRDYGIYHYNYVNFKFKEKYVAPADSDVHIFYVLSGQCNYEGINVKQGDILLFGMNKTPVSSEMTEIELLVVTLDYELIYRIIGIKPAQYCEKAIFLDEDNKFVKIIRSIDKSDLEQWIIKFDESMYELICNNEELMNNNFVHAIAAARIIHAYPNASISDICLKSDISTRQLQRQFLDFFGITLKEYAGIVRFTKAFQTMYEKDLITTAVETGYYDQAHLSREFRNRAGNPPNRWKNDEMFHTIKQMLSGLINLKKE